MRALHVALIGSLAGVACSGAKDAKPDETRPAVTPAAPAAAAADAAPAPAVNAVPDRDQDPCSGLFDPPPGATKLCEESVMGQGAEIHWSSWTVTTSRMETFQLYQGRSKGCEGVSSVSKPPLLAVSKGDTRVDIHDVSETGFPTCATKPGPDAKTVVVISGKFTR